MDARGKQIAWTAVLLFVTMGASYRTPNFVVNTSDPHLARQIAEAAEKYRSELSVSWLGKSIPNWYSPCTMTVRIGQNLGAGGATTFLFDRGEVYGWRMTIQGSQQRIFDSVLPHEITHMIFASHFRKPLPRWADEGAATSVECPSERQKQYRSLYQFLTTGRGIAFNQMFAMTEYPRDIMPLYAQGFSLTEYLIRQGGRRKYVSYLESAMESEDWAGALREHYGVKNLGQLQNSWLAWLRQGRPELTPASSDPVMVASHEQPLGGSPRSAVVPAVGTTSPSNSTPISTLASASVPDRVSSADGWRAKGDREFVSSDSPNPYAAVSSKPRRFKEMPLDKMVPIQRGISENPYAQPENRSQMARQQPVQEASQIILEWHRR